MPTSACRDDTSSNCSPVSLGRMLFLLRAWRLAADPVCQVARRSAKTDCSATSANLSCNAQCSCCIQGTTSSSAPTDAALPGQHGSTAEFASPGEAATGGTAAMIAPLVAGVAAGQPEEQAVKSIVGPRFTRA